MISYILFFFESGIYIPQEVLGHFSASHIESGDTRDGTAAVHENNLGFRSSFLQENEAQDVVFAPSIYSERLAFEPGLIHGTPLLAPRAVTPGPNRFHYHQVGHSLP